MHDPSYRDNHLSLIDEQRECRPHGTRYIGVRPIFVNTGPPVFGFSHNSVLVMQASCLISVVGKITVHSHSPQKSSLYVLWVMMTSSRPRSTGNQIINTTLCREEISRCWQHCLCILTSVFVAINFFELALQDRDFALDISEHYLTCISDRVIRPSVLQYGASRAQWRHTCPLENTNFKYKE